MPHSSRRGVASAAGCADNRIMLRWSLGLTVALFLGLFAADAIAETRYVAKTGSDPANNCTSSAAPCLTVKWAVEQATSGDTIQIGPGNLRTIDRHPQNALLCRRRRRDSCRCSSGDGDQRAERGSRRGRIARLRIDGRRYVAVAARGRWERRRLGKWGNRGNRCRLQVEQRRADDASAPGSRGRRREWRGSQQPAPCPRSCRAGNRRPERAGRAQSDLDGKRFRRGQRLR
jgi:hypothetical protein